MHEAATPANRLPESDSSERPTDLSRVLGPWTAAAIVVGTMVGTGIFIVPATMARQAGSVALVMLSWVAGALLALFGALTYAELAAAMPEAGGQYAYLRRAFGERTAFLFGWTHAVLVRPCSGATIATGLLQFATFLVPTLGVPLGIWKLSVPVTSGVFSLAVTPAQVWTVAVLAAVAFINYLGVRLSGRIQVALTALKVSVLVGVVGVAFTVGPRAEPSSVAAGMVGAATVSGFFAALVAALWAYEGWTNLTLIGSEIVDPQRSIPRSLFAGVVTVAVLYVLVNAACFYGLPFGRVAASPSVVSDLIESAVGSGVSLWLTLAMMVSALGSLNSDTLTGARVPYALARDGLFFQFVARIDPRFRTPGGALAFQAVVAAVLALTGTFEELYSLYVFAQWLFYGLAGAAVLTLRRRDPHLVRPYRTWGYPVIPLVFVASCCALTASLWLARPVRSSAGLLLILAGLPLYAFLRRRRARAAGALSAG